MVAAPVIVVLWGVRSDVYQVYAAMSEASSVTLNPAAIMTSSTTIYGTEPAAEFAASVVDNWTQMLLSFGYGKQARDQVERAIEDLSPKLGSTMAADFAGVVLDIEEANVLSAAGERSEATNQLQNAQTLLERICDPGHQSAGACFVATCVLRMHEASLHKQWMSGVSGSTSGPPRCNRLLMRPNRPFRPANLYSQSERSSKFRGLRRANASYCWTKRKRA